MSSNPGNTYRVEGMSCGHCQAAVREQVEKVDGVEGVDIDLASKHVVIRGQFEDATVRAAIAAAGYDAA